jgi:hypothetical protein
MILSFRSLVVTRIQARKGVDRVVAPN